MQEMNVVTLRNTSDFPSVQLLDSTVASCPETLSWSTKRTGDEVVTRWENLRSQELVMLWLWHNGEVREIYRLPPESKVHASLLVGMGVAVVDPKTETCLLSDVITMDHEGVVIGRFD